jgi:PAS domain S-box-containing protein
MSDLVGVLEPSGIVTYASPSHKSVLGMDCSDIEGKSAMHLVYPEDVPLVVQMFSELVSSRQTASVQFRYVHAEGYPNIADATGTPILKENGEIDHLLVVAKDIRERKGYEKRLEEMAFYDSLTGLPNRRMLKERFQHELNHAKRNRQRLAVLFLDIDGFKQINDTYGHDSNREISGIGFIPTRPKSDFRFLSKI